MKNHEGITGGYEDGSEQAELKSGKLWLLRRIEAGLFSGIVAQIVCDGEVRSTVALKNEEEFNWLKPRIDGVQESFPGPGSTK